MLGLMPRVKIVTRAPDASRRCVRWLLMKPVPPRIRMFMVYSGEDCSPGYQPGNQSGRLGCFVNSVLPILVSAQSATDEPIRRTGLHEPAGRLEAIPVRRTG